MADHESKTDDNVWREIASDAREVELQWRDARFQLGDRSPGSAEAARLRTEMRALQEEYARLIEDARSDAREWGAHDGAADVVPAPDRTSTPQERRNELGALAELARARDGQVRYSTEWQQAVEIEEAAIARIRRWSGPREDSVEDAPRLELGADGDLDPTYAVARPEGFEPPTY